MNDPTTMPDQAYRSQKPMGEWEYHPEMMQPGRLLELAKRRGVRVQRDERGVVIVCAQCEGQIMALIPSDWRGRRRAAEMSDRERRDAQVESVVWGPTCVVDLGQLLADTVRHGVMIHDDALSGAGKVRSSG